MSRHAVLHGCRDRRRPAQSGANLATYVFNSRVSVVNKSVRLYANAPCITIMIIHAHNLKVARPPLRAGFRRGPGAAGRQQPKKLIPSPLIPAARLFLVGLCFSMFSISISSTWRNILLCLSISSTWGNPEVGGRG